MIWRQWSLAEIGWIWREFWPWKKELWWVRSSWVFFGIKWNTQCFGLKQKVFLAGSIKRCGLGCKDGWKLPVRTLKGDACKGGNPRHAAKWSFAVQFTCRDEADASFVITTQWWKVWRSWVKLWLLSSREVTDFRVYTPPSWKDLVKPSNFPKFYFENLILFLFIESYKDRSRAGLTQFLLVVIFYMTIIYNPKPKDSSISSSMLFSHGQFCVTAITTKIQTIHHPKALPPS